MQNKLYFMFYCLFICLIILLADCGQLPLFILGTIPHYDWIAHMVLYGIFYRLLDRFLMGRRVTLYSWSFSTAFLLTSLLMITEEVTQIFLASRTFSLMDLFMGFLGIILFRFISLRGERRGKA